MHSEWDVVGLIRLREKLQSQLRDLLKERPRGNVDQNLMSEIARLESSLTIAKDDLVGIFLVLDHSMRSLMNATPLFRVLVNFD